MGRENPAEGIALHDTGAAGKGYFAMARGRIVPSSGRAPMGILLATRPPRRRPAASRSPAWGCKT